MKQTEIKLIKYPENSHSFIKRGWGCGYVVIPENNPLYGETDTMSEILTSFNVHGGITFAGFDDEGNYMVGFDTSHLHDNLFNCTREFIEKEAYSLKDQIDAYYPCGKQSLNGKTIDIDGFMYRLELI